MTRIQRGLEEGIHYGTEVAPTLGNYTHEVFQSIDYRTRLLAERAIGTVFQTGTTTPILALSTESFPEQFDYLTSKSPEFEDNLLDHGLACMTDTIKLQTVNQLLGRTIGDKLVLANSESFLTFCEEYKVLTMFGRYSGDEHKALVGPKEHLDPTLFQNDFIDHNLKFIKKHPLYKILETKLDTMRELYGSDFEYGATIQVASLPEMYYDNEENTRLRELLNITVDGIQGKLEHKGSSSLAEDIIMTLKKPRVVNNLFELQNLEKLLDDQTRSLYRTTIHQLKKEAHAIKEAAYYAEKGAFESLYPRQSVYRMETFLSRTMAMAHEEDIVLIKSSAPLLKSANSYSHAYGDAIMLYGADFLFHYGRPTQHHGSFLHQVPLADYERVAKDISILSDRQPDDYFRVVPTLGMSDHTGTIKPFIIRSSTSEEDVWHSIDLLKGCQLINEISTLVSRIRLSNNPTGALENLKAYATSRKNVIVHVVNEVKRQLQVGGLNQEQSQAILNSLPPRPTQ